MVVDPTQPEKGVFTDFFRIPTSCSCSIVNDGKETAGKVLLDELMKPRNNEEKLLQSPTKRNKSTKKESSYSSYDYNYDDGYFDEETTTSQAGNATQIIKIFLQSF